MYAYCNNNPIKYIDPCGTCMHNKIVNEDCPICKKEKQLNELAGIENTPDSDTYYVEADNLDIDGMATTVALTTAGVVIESFGHWFRKVIASTTRSGNISKAAFNQIKASAMDDVLRITKGASDAIGYISVGIDVAIGIDYNINNGASFKKIAYDGSVDLILSGGPIAVSSFVGTLVSPGLGTVIGFGIGVVSYVFIDLIPWSDDQTAREMLKSKVQ